MPMDWEDLVTQIDAQLPKEVWAQTLIGIGVLVLTALFVQWVVARVVLLLAHRLLVLTGHDDWDKALQRRRAYQNLWYAVPFAVVSMGIDLVPHVDRAAEIVGRLAHAGAWICVFVALSGVLSAWQDTYSATTRAQTRSIKGYIQIGKLVLMAICTVLVLSILIDRSPLWMISGLGALSAVLLLVFKDTLLSLVASTQLTSNDMLRIGDWIEMPQSNADGFVKDIALHTVKVQNWDNTVTTVPTYKLFSESYRNYRHMFESGGRRIKRTLRIDAASVRFLTDEEAGRLMRFRLLRDYLQAKTSDIAQANQHMGEQAAVPANRRRLTNIGTFRVYALAYLKQNPEVRQDMAMMVRMMEPQSDGIPVEVYCFTAVTAWVEYERIQGDIFDHLLAILPELGMRLYQQPSGADIGEMGGRLRESAMREWAATASGRRGRNCHASPGRPPRPPHAIIFRSIVTYLETPSMSAARRNCADQRPGDLAGNAAKVLEAARKAHAEGADVLVTPELVLTGYPPEDLLLRPLFVQTQQDVLDRLRHDLAGLAGLHVLVGHVQARQGHNAASVLCEGRVLGTYCKRELPNYSVFDEQRYFSAHGEALVFNVKGVRFGVNICEDIWFDRAPRAAAQAGAQVLLVPNASPYNTGKQEERLEVARRCARENRYALIYANMVGGQDELVFDGASSRWTPPASRRRARPISPRA